MPKQQKLKIPPAKQLPSGSWRARVYYNGESIAVTDKDKSKAEAECARILAERIAGYEKKQTTGITLREAFDAYIDRCKRKNMSPSTLRGYCSYRDNHFVELMDKPLANISAGAFQKAVDEIAAGHSAKTVANIVRLLRSVIKNSGIAVPEIDYKEPIVKEREFLDFEQIGLFVNAIKGSEYELQFLLALNSLRRSEILALRWNDIDFKAETIRVDGAIVVDEDCQYTYKDETKTKTSRRVVPVLIPRIMELLKEGRSEDEDALIYQHHPHTLLWALHKIIEENDLPPVTLHGLRHSFASLCYHFQTPVEQCQRWGGWSNLQTLQAVYTHLNQKDTNSEALKQRAFYESLYMERPKYTEDETFKKLEGMASTAKIVISYGEDGTKKTQENQISMKGGYKSQEEASQDFAEQLAAILNHGRKSKLVTDALMNYAVMCTNKSA